LIKRQHPPNYFCAQAHSLFDRHQTLHQEYLNHGKRIAGASRKGSTRGRLSPFEQIVVIVKKDHPCVAKVISSIEACQKIRERKAEALGIRTF